MRIPNLVRLIEEEERKLSNIAYGIPPNAYEDKGELVRVLMIYERTQHLLNANISWQGRFTAKEINKFSKEAATVMGGTAVGEYIIEEYGPIGAALREATGSRCYGISGLNLSIDRIRTHIQLLLIDIEYQEHSIYPIGFPNANP